MDDCKMKPMVTMKLREDSVTTNRMLVNLKKKYKISLKYAKIR